MNQRQGQQGQRGGNRNQFGGQSGQQGSQQRGQRNQGQFGSNQFGQSGRQSNLERDNDRGMRGQSWNHENDSRYMGGGSSDYGRSMGNTGDWEGNREPAYRDDNESQGAFGPDRGWDRDDDRRSQGGSSYGDETRYGNGGQLSQWHEEGSRYGRPQGSRASGQRSSWNQDSGNDYGLAMGQGGWGDEGGRSIQQQGFGSSNYGDRQGMSGRALSGQGGTFGQVGSFGGTGGLSGRNRASGGMGGSSYAGGGNSWQSQGQQRGYMGQDQGGQSWGAQGQGGQGLSYKGKGPKGYKRSDDRVKETINDFLLDHDEIDASEIDVQVKDGEVTLTGTVSERNMKRMVEQEVENLAGVNEVVNQLRVKREDHQNKSGNGSSTGTDQSKTEQNKIESRSFGSKI